jgi:hypothetical protein
MRRVPPALPPTEYVITTLAEYQTSFWSAVADTLKRLGHSVSFISFDDNSTTALRAEGLKVYAVDRQSWRQDQTRESIEATLARFQLNDTPYWYVHEKSMFRLSDESMMDRRLCIYLRLCESALADVVERGFTPVVIQELGGFLSVIAAFTAARTAGFDNWFIEPSFYRGRCFWSPNTFMAKKIGPGSTRQLEPEALSYLKDAQASRSIVIPIKDAHQYNSPISKLMKFRNLVRLLGKISDKYLLGKKQEFDHLWVHTAKHLEMVFATFSLRNRYTSLDQLTDFVYYPLHVPGDMALTLRSATYLDQPAFIETLARQLPRGVKLAIKEHPAMIGALGASRLRRLLKDHSNIALIDPGTNNYEVMGKAAVIVSVNSKSGAEALLLDRPVVVMGDAFYRGSGVTKDVDAPDQIRNAVAAMLADRPTVSSARRDAFFSAVWRQSLPGELYVNVSDNIRIFAQSLVEATRRAR